MNLLHVFFIQTDFKSFIIMRTPYDEVRISIRVEYPILVRVRAHCRCIHGKIVRVKVR